MPRSRAPRWPGPRPRAGSVKLIRAGRYACTHRCRIDALVAERTQAKKTRNFARADAIRNDLLAKGILIEDSKDGVRWKRK